MNFIREYRENENIKTKILRKYSNNVRKNQFSEIKNSLSELEKDFIELKDRIKRQRNEN